MPNKKRRTVPEGVIPTGIRELDSLLGGGLLEDSTLLISYETTSFGWVLAIEVFRKLLAEGGFGIVTNYSFPFLLLERYAKSIRYDVFKEGVEGKLVVLDVFGSVNGVRLDYPFVYYIPGVDSTTFLDKTVSVYRRILKLAENRRPIGISVTLDGMVDLFGEEATVRILRRNIAMKMRAREEEKERPRPVNIFLLNRDRVSTRFIAWLSQYMEHVIEFRITEKPGIERMVVRKSLLPEFIPVEAVFKFSRGRFEIEVPLRL
jgi:hypothetical protein